MCQRNISYFLSPIAPEPQLHEFGPTASPSRQIAIDRPWPAPYSCATHMQITAIVCQILRVRSVQKKTASSQDVVLVRVRTNTGLEGIGEADASPEVVKAII